MRAPHYTVHSNQVQQWSSVRLLTCTVSAFLFHAPEVTTQTQNQCDCPKGELPEYRLTISVSLDSTSGFAFRSGWLQPLCSLACFSSKARHHGPLSYAPLQGGKERNYRKSYLHFCKRSNNGSRWKSSITREEVSNTTCKWAATVQKRARLRKRGGKCSAWVFFK